MKTTVFTDRPVNPHDLARSGYHESGTIEGKKLPRFQESVDSPADLEAGLTFGRDEAGTYIDVSLKGSPELRCEGCMSTYRQPLEVELRLRPIHALEQARELADTEEPVMLQEGFLNVINMLEDEALLALPSFARCDNCINDE